ncbi:MAG TPA: hypothetical protein VN911_13080 [Candidatus Acidoferrum sp.]|nr:hypothetical protein [Candidatus Acidoferrum sp.]
MKVDYEWQRPYVAAVLETDRSKLAQRIEEASGAINTRMLELNRDHPGTPEERMAIEFALSGLKMLSEDAPKPKPHS